jgi:hypothetical protein
MAKKAKPTAHVPPLPPLSWDGYFWTAQIVLPSWAGFQCRLGPYGARSSSKPSDGTASLTVAARDDDAASLLTPEQVQAYQYLLEHEAETQHGVLQAIFDEYPTMRFGFLEAVDEEEFHLMPDIQRPEDLRPLMGLSQVHILNVSKDGVAYVGFEFGCTWESEHGLGVMTHRGRVVAVGYADVSFLDWIAERDATSRTLSKRKK